MVCQGRRDCIGRMILNKNGAPEKVKVAKLMKGESVTPF
jgi:hypothetical protein